MGGGKAKNKKGWEQTRVVVQTSKNKQATRNTWQKIIMGTQHIRTSHKNQLRRNMRQTINNKTASDALTHETINVRQTKQKHIFWLKLNLRLGPSVAKEMSLTIQPFFISLARVFFFNLAGHLLKCLPPHIRNQNAKVRICCIFPPCQIQIYFSTKKTRTEKWRRLVWSVSPELSRGANWWQKRFLPRNAVLRNL